MDTSTAEYEAILYDLDGTLVRLAVDWTAVEREIATVLRTAGADPDGLVTWDLLDAADAVGVREEVEAILARHEREGARRADRLPLADALLDDEVPTGVVSLNAEAAVRIALEKESLLEAVDVVVGRDTVDARKPDPEPVLAALDVLSVAPEDALFVGDSETDEQAAERAGVAFRRV
ncbi:HAD superfamily hydrolase [Halanaeroarchaeum sp. HSR-CO]|uniref:HAD family hydrolase n=1 Tax=Halanaeroarchaeum sp. HSR-CO TaxID=2866382 RepID=UPI00217D5CF9|nr:HAD-IA family hydrolase [Halanaeroarchaeum sp. HSR-CO]UWG48475.1 HAD superfamily hydrolase [Halanaeroarchaeum sp. HSR-CO]